MAGLFPVGQESQTNGHCITIEFEKDEGESKDGLSNSTSPSTVIDHSKSVLKGYEQCIGMILVIIISFSTLVALLRDVYQQGQEILMGDKDAIIEPEWNYTLLHNDTIKAYFIN